MRWLVAVVLAIVATQNPAGRAAGRITGVAVDGSGAPIPGTTITLRWAESESSTVTDPKGAFRFFDVLPGRYAVIASLQGFYSEPHTGVIVSSGETVSLKFVLETDCLSAADYIDMGLPWVLKEADVVALIRIPALHIPAACAVPSHCNCTLHYATALRVMKGKPSREFRLLQEGAGYGTRERPYAPGDEFIAFLKRDDESHGFGRVMGPHYVFPVRDGRVGADVTGRLPPGFRDGMTIAEFERALRAVR